MASEFTSTTSYIVQGLTTKFELKEKSNKLPHPVDQNNIKVERDFVVGGTTDYAVALRQTTTLRCFASILYNFLETSSVVYDQYLMSVNCNLPSTLCRLPSIVDRVPRSVETNQRVKVLHFEHLTSAYTCLQLFCVSTKQTTSYVQKNLS